MEFRILGPLELDDGGDPVVVPAGRERALLLDLLVHRNDTVTVDVLIDDLWDGRPPATATKIIQNGVSRLRRELGGDRLETKARGYVLRVEAGELDVDRALALAERARAEDPVRAAETLREAVALWRGRPLAEVASMEFAQAEIHRLEDLRLVLTERRFEAELAAGRGPGLVVELEELLAANPLRERLRAQLMIALYRAGRRADALQSYRDAERLLSQELGLEPGRELEEVNRRILADDPGLDSPAPRTVGGRRRRRLIGVGAAAVCIALALGAWFALAGHRSRAVHITADTVVRLDPSTGRATTSLAVGTAPGSVALDRLAIWTVNFEDQTVTRLSRGGRAATAAGTTAPATALATGAGAAWALSSYDGNLSRIDERTGRITQIVPVGSQPTALAVGSAVFVTNQSSGTLVRVDPVTLHRSLLRHGLAGPSGVVAEGSLVWVAESFRNRILEVDGRTGRTLRTLAVSLSPDALALGSDAVWATNPAENEVTRVDLHTGLFRLISVGADPFAIAAGSRYVWVVNNLDHSISELDGPTGDVLRTIVLTHGFPESTPGKATPPELTPGGIAADPDGAAWLTVQRF